MSATTILTPSFSESQPNDIFPAQANGRPSAIIVNNVYKKFGKAADKDRLAWLPWRRSDVSNIPKTPEGNNSAANSKKPFVIAVDHVSFEVQEGEIFGVLGPNGSGKSTLIRLISTLLLPDDGVIRVFGHDVVQEPMSVQRLINRVSVEASFFKKLSPMENLLYGARLYGLDGRETRKQVVIILKRLGLEDRSIRQPMEQMSRGMQQKVAIARALLSHPRVLLLDEPTTGLDPRSKREVQTVVRELQQQDNTTILLTTHDMAEAETLCDRITIMDKGKVVALGSPDELRRLVPRQNGHQPSLEDVFLALTGRELVADEDKA
ncbi:MAG: ABC transporter ATP-binding protein [Chloroflexi bacterium]|nr:ABC transporter ATP-binding protein [Chloroflexota bacterium]